MVLGALLGLLVLWFTVLRHERTVRHRAALRPRSGMGLGVGLETGSGSGSDGVVAFSGLGAAADEKAAPAEATSETEPGVEAESEAGASARAESGAEFEAGDGGDGVVAAVEADEAGGEPAGGGGDEGDDEAAGSGPGRSAEPSGASQAAGGGGKRKLTDEILSRVESELAGRRTPRWKELAELVHREFGVSVHPSSIQRAVKKRRVAAARSGMGRMGDVGAAADEMGGVGVAEPVMESASEPVMDSASGPVMEPVTQCAAEPVSASVEPRGEVGDGVRPNGGRRASSWSSPACPAGDAG